MTIERTVSSSVDSARRSFLSQAASVAAGSAVLAAGVSLPSSATALQGVPDPIFAAIEAHRAARAIWVACLNNNYDLESELGPQKHLSRVDAWEEKIVETDDPRWIESERAVMRTSDAETDAACKLVDTRPTTPAGVLALLQYALAADIDGEGWPSDLTDDGKRSRSWHYFLVENLAETMATLAGEEA